MSPCVHLFPPKNISLISGKGNIGLLLICILQAWKWPFKRKFWFSITGETLCFANYNAICRRQWERRRHVFGHDWMNLLLFARWKSSCKRKKKLFKVICEYSIRKNNSVNIWIIIDPQNVGTHLKRACVVMTIKCHTIQLNISRQRTTMSEVIVRGKQNIKQNRNWFYFKFSVESSSQSNHAQDWHFNLTITSWLNTNSLNS